MGTPELSAVLSRKFLLYTGPINATAYNKKTPEGGQKAFDQHSVFLQMVPDIDEWESGFTHMHGVPHEEGTLKVYCPSMLPAFPPGEQLSRFNRIIQQMGLSLRDGIQFMDAMNCLAPDDRAFVVSHIQQYLGESIGFRAEHLARYALDENFHAYDRSISLYTVFAEEDKRIQWKQRSIEDQMTTAIARQKAIYAAMAPHYAMEAIFDDQFANYPFHLPDHIQNEIDRFGPVYGPKWFNRNQYENGMFFSIYKGPSPDMYRFSPILASLIAPYILRSNGIYHTFSGWDEFQRDIVNGIHDVVTRQAFDNFARSMNIPLEYAYFGGYKMCQKEIRKRGVNHLFGPEEARRQALKLQRIVDEGREYFTAHDPYLRMNYYEEQDDRFLFADGRPVSKEEFALYRHALVAKSAVLYINAVIGTYKFIPWVKNDLNFEGVGLPYAIMKEEKKRIRSILLNPACDRFWCSGTDRFRRALKDVLETEPSMYAKWFIPALDNGMLIQDIIQQSEHKMLEYLGKLI